jgi:hypothetical protein
MKLLDTTPTKITLDVATIDLADRSGPIPNNSPYATNHFSPTINDAVRQWAKDRLQAGGPAGHAAMVIKDATFTAENIPTSTGIDAWFKREQGMEYIAHADVYIEANNPSGYGMTEATASRSVTLPEHPTATEKQDAYYTLINGLMKDLGNNLESGIASHLFKFTMSANSASMNMADQALEMHPAPIIGDAPILSKAAITSAPISPAPVSPAPIADIRPEPKAQAFTSASLAMPSPTEDDPIIIDGNSSPPVLLPSPAQEMPSAPVIPSSGTVSIPLSGPTIR